MDHTYKEMVLKGTVLRCSGYDPKCKGNGRELDCSINKKRFLLARNSIISCAGQNKNGKMSYSRMTGDPEVRKKGKYAASYLLSGCYKRDKGKVSLGIPLIAA